MMDPKPTAPRDPAYLAFVRSKPCIVCMGPAEAHHALGRRGTGVKPSDFGCIPVCRKHHYELHHWGGKSFQSKHDVDFREIALNLLHLYHTGQTITIVI
jgi:hypothetical protein